MFIYGYQKYKNSKEFYYLRLIWDKLLCLHMATRSTRIAKNSTISGLWLGQVAMFIYGYQKYKNSKIFFYLRLLVRVSSMFIYGCLKYKSSKVFYYLRLMVGVSCYVYIWPPEVQEYKRILLPQAYGWGKLLYLYMATRNTRKAKNSTFSG